MGQEREASADYPAWAPQAAPLGAGMSPSRDGEGGRPGAGGLWFGRSSVGPGEGAVSPGGSAWARRACWVPLPCQEPKTQVNDPRRKGNSGSANLTRLNHCQREGVRPQGREETVLTSPGRRIPGPTPPRGVEAAQPRGGWGCEPSFCGPGGPQSPREDEGAVGAQEVRGWGATPLARQGPPLTPKPELPSDLTPGAEERPWRGSWLRSGPSPCAPRGSAGPSSVCGFIRVLVFLFFFPTCGFSRGAVS